MLVQNLTFPRCYIIASVSCIVIGLRHTMWCCHEAERSREWWQGYQPTKIFHQSRDLPASWTLTSRSATKGRQQHSHKFQLGIISKHQMQHCNSKIYLATDLIFYTIWKCVCHLKMCTYVSLMLLEGEHRTKNIYTLLRNSQGLNLKKKQGQGLIR